MPAVVAVVVLVLVLGASKASPDAARHPAASYLEPDLGPIRAIVRDKDNGTIRDPTSPIFDEESGMWHFFATRVAPERGQSGYGGRIWHYHSVGADINGSWVDAGESIGVSADPTAFDAYGTFTPSLGRDTEGWFLFYGGVSNASSAHAEAIGMARAASPFGPWMRVRDNPVITPEFAASWCSETDQPARVDEAEPYLFQGKTPLVLVKTVCVNFTALPIILYPSDDHVFRPPFKPGPGGVRPIIEAASTPKRKGFEQARLFKGPNGLVHLTGHYHGAKACPHFVADPDSTAETGIKWVFVGNLSSTEFCKGSSEPAPVVAKDTIAPSLPPFFVQFNPVPPEGTIGIYLMNVSWVEAPSRAVRH